MKNITILIILLYLLNSANAQNNIHSTLNDCKTKEPIAYAHIGILEKGIGTISNDQGVFSLKIPEANQNDILTISSVGYETQQIPINAIKSNIELCPVNIQLKEIVIIPKKEVILGRNKTTGNATYTFLGIGSGGEIASKIKNNKNIVPTKVGIYFKDNNCDLLKVRVTFYKAYKNKIGEIINTKPIIQSITPTKESWFDFDIPEIMNIDGDFFVSVEILQSSTKGQKCPTMFQGNYHLTKSNTYMRTKSHDKWETWKIEFPVRVTVNYD